MLSRQASPYWSISSARLWSAAVAWTVCACALAANVGLSDEEFSRAVSETKVVDFGSGWQHVPPQDRRHAGLLVRASEDQLNGLINSPDSRQRSIALLILFHRSDVARLASLSAWLDDPGPTVPRADLPSAGGVRGGSIFDQQYNVAPSVTLGELLAIIYSAEFGTQVRTPEEFRQVYGHITDFETLAKPWFWRLQNAKFFPAEAGPPDPEQTLEGVKQRVRALPPATRAFVIVSGIDFGYTREEAVAELRAIGPDLRERARDDSFRPPDPCFQLGPNDQSEAVRKRIGELLAMVDE